MNGGRSKFGRKHQQAIAALLTEPTHEQAAKKAGISATTLQRWLGEPGFQEEYRLARQQAFDDAMELLRTSTGMAARKLIEKLESGKDGDAIRAAMALLEFAFRAKSIFALEEKIKELEAAIGEIRHESGVTSQPRAGAGQSDGPGTTAPSKPPVEN